MDELVDCIVYSNEQVNLIKSLEAENNQKQKIWDLDELEELKKSIRTFYRKEQKLLCAYCKYPVSTVYPTNCHIEHIAPKSIHPEYVFEPKTYV